MPSLETDETEALIASDKVEGTAVYGANHDKLGSIHSLMIDKHTGQVEYAVLTFGGLWGLGADFYPLPWDVLTYDVDQSGYVVDIDKETLKGAPHFGAEEAPRFDRSYGATLYEHYGVDYPLS